MLDVFAQGLGRGIAVAGLQGHRLEHDSLERPGHRGLDPARLGKVSLDDAGQGFREVGADERRLAGQNTVERRSQAVDIAGGAEPVDLPGRLLRAHERGSSDQRAGDGLGRPAQRGRNQWPLAVSLVDLVAWSLPRQLDRRGTQRDRPAPVPVRIELHPEHTRRSRFILRKASTQRLGQAPIDNERLAVLAEHHIGRLEIAVEHAPAVGVGNRLADIHEMGQQPPQ